jgi:hypothetical protein
LATTRFAEGSSQVISVTDEGCYPISILGDLSGQTFDIGLATTSAVGKLTDTLASLGFNIAFSKETQEDAVNSSKPNSFHFDPPKSRFELRRHPIPARFLGLKDHAMIRDTEHKIFLNLSETEVLCTTTAEALAMGKFVIIPSHPSNIFFTQFPNCLSFKTKEECVEQIKWALESDPQPLSDEHRYTLSWDGAIKRLYKASALTKTEVEQRRESGTDKADRDIARFHIESRKKGQLILRFITGEK